jgi:hypothetical protein
MNEYAIFTDFSLQPQVLASIRDDDSIHAIFNVLSAPYDIGKFQFKIFGMTIIEKAVMILANSHTINFSIMTKRTFSVCCLAIDTRRAPKTRPTYQKISRFRRVGISLPFQWIFIDRE